uniref:Uncharacterized protein n=1 Tax=viral metagenome TaxID=1070528 RepID=A0A6C0H466_9ZZZZ
MSTDVDTASTVDTSASNTDETSTGMPTGAIVAIVIAVLLCVGALVWVGLRHYGIIGGITPPSNDSGNGNDSDSGNGNDSDSGSGTHKGTHKGSHKDTDSGTHKGSHKDTDSGTHKGSHKGTDSDTGSDTEIIDPTTGLTCGDDNDCKKHAPLSKCDIWNRTGCYNPKCTADSDCKDPNNPICDTQSNSCVNSKCVALFGKTSLGDWYEQKSNNQCLPPCSANNVSRSNSGWCKESDASKCPSGWQFKQVKGNPDGNGHGGSEVDSNVCVPVTNCPPGWSVEKNKPEGYCVPPCRDNTRPYREEGYCVYNSSGDCLLGYSKYTNSDGMGWPHYIDYCGPSTKT